jgi:hypothetical protein
MANNDICERFQLNDGQFFSTYARKNLHWFLNGEQFGFGDLREDDIMRIQMRLQQEDVFEGFNEHHMSMFMQRENPVVVIKFNYIGFPQAVPVSEKTRNDIRMVKG